jgi:hypothetical protein
MKKTKQSKPSFYATENNHFCWNSSNASLVAGDPPWWMSQPLCDETSKTRGMGFCFAEDMPDYSIDSMEACVTKCSENFKFRLSSLSPLIKDSKCLTPYPEKLQDGTQVKKDVACTCWAGTNESVELSSKNPLYSYHLNQPGIVDSEVINNGNGHGTDGKGRFYVTSPDKNGKDFCPSVIMCETAAETTIQNGTIENGQCMVAMGLAPAEHELGHRGTALIGVNVLNYKSHYYTPKWNGRLISSMDGKPSQPYIYKSCSDDGISKHLCVPSSQSWGGFWNGWDGGIPDADAKKISAETTTVVSYPGAITQ